MALKSGVRSMWDKANWSKANKIDGHKSPKLQTLQSLKNQGISEYIDKIVKLLIVYQLIKINSQKYTLVMKFYV